MRVQESRRYTLRRSSDLRSRRNGWTRGRRGTIIRMTIIVVRGTYDNISIWIDRIGRISNIRSSSIMVMISSIINISGISGGGDCTREGCR